MKAMFGQLCLNILARSAAHHPICDFASDIIMKNGQRIFGSARIGNGPDPVAAQIPGAECEIVRKTILSEPLVGNRGVIAPQLGVNMPIFSEDGNLILNLDHKNCVCLGINALDVPHHESRADVKTP